MTSRSSIMKTYSNFIIEASFIKEDAEVANKAWQDWMNRNPKEFAKGGSFYEKKPAASAEFIKSHVKTGDIPDWAKEIDKKRQSASSTPPPGPSRTSTPPPGPSRTSTLKNITGRGLNIVSKGVGRGLYGYGAVDAFSNKQYGQAGLLGGLAVAPNTMQKFRPAAQKVVQKGFQRIGQKTAGNIASRLVPGVGATLGTLSAAEALKNKDYIGVPLGLASGVPGPIGATAIAADVARQTIPQTWERKEQIRKATENLSKELVNKGEAVDKGRFQPYGYKTARKAQSTVLNRGARDVASAYGQYGSKMGSAITGSGGPNTFVELNKKNVPFLSTGSGSNRRTVQLPSTKLVRDPKSGRQVVGDLAYRSGSPVYMARGSTSSRDTSASIGGAWRNLQRSLNIGGQRQRDAEASKREYRTALANTQRYTKGLNISTQSATKQKLPGYGVGSGKVGPAKVGPKIVGQGIVGPRRPGFNPQRRFATSSPASFAKGA